MALTLWNTTARLLRLLLLLGVATPLAGQSPRMPADTAALIVTRDTGPVAVPDPSPEAVSYYRSGNALWVVTTLWGFLVLGALLVTGFSARLRDLAGRVGRGWFFTVAIYAALFTVVTWLLDLPLAFYSGYVRPHAYGLSNQTLGAWIGEHLTGLAVGVVALALTLWIPYLLLRKSPRRWWLHTSLVAIPLTALALLIVPVWIDPLFDDYGPMRDQSLEARILALAERAGVEGSRVYQVEKSEDTDALNAHVAGLGATKRIVLWDTTLEVMDEGEVLFVMGHEIGHYVLRHTYWLLATMVLLILVSLYVTYRSSDWLISRFGHRFRFGSMADVASFPLLLLIVSAVNVATTPLVFTLTRHFEREADRFGLEITRDNRSAAQAFIHLQSENLVVPYPGPIYRLWRESHPSLGERIEFANRYRPWERGEPLRYQRLIGEEE